MIYFILKKYILLLTFLIKQKFNPSQNKVVAWVAGFDVHVKFELRKSDEVYGLRDNE